MTAPAAAAVEQAPQAMTSPEVSAPVAASRTCPQCGNSLNLAAMFCGKCGYDFSKKSAGKAAGQDKVISKPGDAAAADQPDMNAFPVTEIASIPPAAKAETQAAAAVAQAEAAITKPALQMPTASPEATSKRSTGLIAAIVIALVCVTGAGAYWWFDKRPAESAPAPAAEAASTQAPPVQAPAASSEVSPSETAAPPVAAETAPPEQAPPAAEPPVAEPAPAPVKQQAHTKTPTAHVARPGDEMKAHNITPRTTSDENAPQPREKSAAAQEKVRPRPVAAQKTIDEQYNERAAKECKTGLMGLVCRESLKFELCGGKWAEVPPPGQSLCKQKPQKGFQR